MTRLIPLFSLLNCLASTFALCLGCAGLRVGARDLDGSNLWVVRIEGGDVAQLRCSHRILALLIQHFIYLRRLQLALKVQIRFVLSELLFRNWRLPNFVIVQISRVVKLWLAPL